VPSHFPTDTALDRIKSWLSTGVGEIRSLKTYIYRCLGEIVVQFNNTSILGNICIQNEQSVRYVKCTSDKLAL